jgi:hypothetical protein
MTKDGPYSKIDLVDISTISSDRRAYTYYAARAASRIDGIYIKRNFVRKILEIVAAACGAEITLDKLMVHGGILRET